jgi:3-keto-5-aminohexanoate cleavage enzyme
MSNPVVVTAALTGPIATKADHPTLPCSPAEIAAAAAQASAAGAAVVHLHLRDEQGLPTADLDVARRVASLVADSCPALIQLSTGVGLNVSYEDRARLVEVRPQMATLNVCSMTFAGGEFRNPPDQVRRLAARMRELEIRPEIEIYDTGHLDFALQLLKEDLLAPPQVIGIGRHNLPMTAIGLAMGGNARTGMEDTLMLRRGVPATDNGELVERLAGLARALERTPATPGEARQLLRLDPPVAVTPS